MSTKPSFPPLSPSPFTPPFDELFSLYHGIPMRNNPHISGPPCSVISNLCPGPFRTPINPPQFGSLSVPPKIFTTIDDYFDLYATPHDERMRLLGLCKDGIASNWLQWMRMKESLDLFDTQFKVVASSSMLTDAQRACILDTQMQVVEDPLPPPPRVQLRGDVLSNMLQRMAQGMQKACQMQVVAATPPPWIELPGDVMSNILQRLGAEGILTSAQKVCTTWWKLSKDPALWKLIDFSNPRQGIFNDEYNLMCRRAVERSHGQLLDLTIHYFGDDALLDYIVNRSPNLKRLQLGTCFFISGNCARRMAAKLPHLEELHLTIRPGIGARDIQLIGESCPILKSFSCNGFKCTLPTPVYDSHGSIRRYYRNLFAHAISTSMPNLQHLQIFAHWIENEGLEAILNGCPQLQSLDIRRCFDLDLQGDLGERCRLQIKNLKLPYDSVSDVPWPNCDGGDPFAPFAFVFEKYVYPFTFSAFPNYHYLDYADYFRHFNYNFSGHLQ